MLITMEIILKKLNITIILITLITMIVVVEVV